MLHLHFHLGLGGGLGLGLFCRTKTLRSLHTPRLVVLVS